MSNKRKRQNLFTKAKESLDFWAETVILEFTEELLRIMQETGVTGAQLAERIGTSPAYVSKVLNGNANVSLATMNKFARAFNHAVHIHLADENAVVTWSDRASQHVIQGVGAQVRAIGHGKVELRIEVLSAEAHKILQEGNTIQPFELVGAPDFEERGVATSMSAYEPEPVIN